VLIDFGAGPFCFIIFCGFCVEKSDFGGIRGKSGSVFVDKMQTKYVYRFSVRTSGRPRTYNKESFERFLEA